MPCGKCPGDEIDTIAVLSEASNFSLASTTLHHWHPLSYCLWSLCSQPQMWDLQYQACNAVNNDNDMLAGQLIGAPECQPEYGPAEGWTRLELTLHSKSEFLKGLQKLVRLLAEINFMSCVLLVPQQLMLSLLEHIKLLVSKYPFMQVLH